MVFVGSGSWLCCKNGCVGGGYVLDALTSFCVISPSLQYPAIEFFAVSDAAAIHVASCATVTASAEGFSNSVEVTAFIIGNATYG